jgi:hypothetical protein
VEHKVYRIVQTEELQVVRVKSYKEAVRLETVAGEDAANRRMRKAGR